KFFNENIILTSFISKLPNPLSYITIYRQRRRKNICASFRILCLKNIIKITGAIAFPILLLEIAIVLLALEFVPINSFSVPPILLQTYDNDYITLQLTEFFFNSAGFGKLGHGWPTKENAKCWSNSRIGTNSATNVIGDMVRSFPNLRFVITVGISGKILTIYNNIRFGDVIVSVPGNRQNGIRYYDFRVSKQNADFKEYGYLNGPPIKILGIIARF
ncbi:uncharacterized protein PgNI_12093, partial [Pyricularia grisea]|uniref:Uncharacterized protein n=1 Tax=Pyricularia grisea TaxID=148305 RepID=A0A6P8AQD8_PYRGI